MITSQTHCADETAPWHSIQYAAFSRVVSEYDLCKECQEPAIAASSSMNDPYDLPPSYRIQPVQSCQRADRSVETYQDIMARKEWEAEARKVQIHLYPKLDPLSTPEWLQQPRSRRTIFDKIRERRKETEERITQSMKLEFESNRSQEAMEASISDSGYVSEATNEATEPKDVPVSEDSAELESEPEPAVLEGSGGLSPVNAGRWARQRRVTTARLKERLARAAEEAARRAASQ